MVLPQNKSIKIQIRDVHDFIEFTVDIPNFPQGKPNILTTYGGERLRNIKTTTGSKQACYLLKCK